MRPRVLLFDIDGTLLLTGGAGRRAMAAAFRVLHGREDACGRFPFAGMTDRAIVREGLRQIGKETDDGAIDALLEDYLGHLGAELQASAYRVLPGVVELLASLGRHPHVAIGLGTGNVKRGATAKLARGALDGAFAFGGFGCDAEDRVELLRAGAMRGAERLAVSLDACDVVVIGDTPKDVAAARSLGARAIGVGTGEFSPDVLLGLGADQAFGDLADPLVEGALLA